MQTFVSGETTVKAPAPVDEPPPPDELPGKKKYIPPYTPNLDKLKQNPSYNTARSAPSTVTSRSSSSSSSFKPRTAPNRPVNQPNRTVHNPVQSQQQFFANKNAMKKYERSQAVSDDEDDEGKTKSFCILKCLALYPQLKLYIFSFSSNC